MVKFFVKVLTGWLFMIAISMAAVIVFFYGMRHLLVR